MRDSVRELRRLLRVESLPKSHTVRLSLGEDSYADSMTIFDRILESCGNVLGQNRVVVVRPFKTSSNRSWFDAIVRTLVWTFWSCCPLFWAIPRRVPVTDEQRAEIDAWILAGDPRHALRVIRVLFEAGLTEAKGIHWERYHRLRAERTADFACTDEDYWKRLYD